jgi:hypothetical protein
VKTKERLNKYLQQIHDALPERIRERIHEECNRKDHLDIPLVGWFGCNYYGEPEPVSVFLCFTGINADRTRTYPIKKGVLKTKRLIEVVVEKFDKRDTFEREYDEAQERSRLRSIEARALEPIIFPKVKPGEAFELDVDEDGSHLVGGAQLTHKGSGKSTEIWAKDEGTVTGAIPFGPISVDKLNEILRILSK